jgi:hypothetical protein
MRTCSEQCGRGRSPVLVSALQSGARRSANEHTNGGYHGGREEGTRGQVRAPCGYHQHTPPASVPVNPNERGCRRVRYYENKLATLTVINGALKTENEQVLNFPTDA